MSCPHEKLHVEADPCFGRVWTATCCDCGEGDFDGERWRWCGPMGTGKSRDEAVRAFWNAVEECEADNA